MIKHKPIPKTDVRIKGVTYKCNEHGIVELPEAYDRFNPIVKPKKKKVVKSDIAD